MTPEQFEEITKWQKATFGQANTLQLTLKRKWFDMIAAGEKKEEYREIKPYWERRFNPTYTDWGKYKSTMYPNMFYMRFDIDYNRYSTITFRNGYSTNSPTMVVECLGIAIGTAKPEWSDNWKGDVFIIKLGKVLSITNH